MNSVRTRSNPAYLEELRQLWLKGGVTGPFYTEDGLPQLERNRTTVTGGAIALSNGDAAQIATVRREFPAVPAMAGEVYPGWLTHWGEPGFAGTNYDLSHILTAFMQSKRSFNLYVIHGGTSFGFYAGANVDDSGNYQPDITSYDYSAPINEQGTATPKYMKYRDIIGSYLPAPLPDIPDAIATLECTGIDALMPTLYASIWDNLPTALPREQSIDPQSFESYGQAFGFALYRKQLQEYAGGVLDISSVHDYATVFVGEHYVGGVSRAQIPRGVRAAAPRDASRAARPTFDVAGARVEPRWPGIVRDPRGGHGAGQLRPRARRPQRTARSGQDENRRWVVLHAQGLGSLPAADG